MASTPPSHTIGRPSQQRASKVTAQHTLERVRNNQRRHRARRNDYIATLEHKLSHAEQSIKSLNDQVFALQTELAQCRGRDGHTVSTCPQMPQVVHIDSGDRPLLPVPSSPGELDFQALDLLSDPADLAITPLPTLPRLLPFPDSFSGDLGSELVEVSSSRIGSETANGPAESDIHLEHVFPTHSPKCVADASLSAIPGPTGAGRGCTPCSALEPSLQIDSRLINGIGDLLSTTATHDQVLTTTGACCTELPLQPYDEKTGNSAIKACYGDSAERESTILCAEAYLLIAQQNFKGVSQQDVATWLWNGFRRSLIPNEGCRVKTDLLYNLLAFISDA